MDIELYEKKIVRKNSLITAKFNLDFVEYRAMLYIMHKVYSIRDNTAFISAEEFNEDIMSGNKHKGKKEKFIQTMEALTDKSLYINTKEGDILTWKKYKWLATYAAKYKKCGKKNVFIGCEIKIEETLVPYLFGFKKDFTVMYLTEAFNLKTFYAMRLFEILYRFNNREFRANIALFKEYCGIDVNKYTEYKDLKKRVITPSLKEIRNLPGVTVEFEEKRVNRKIAELVFRPVIEVKIEAKDEEVMGIDLNDGINPGSEIPEDYQICGEESIEKFLDEEVEGGTGFIQTVLEVKNELKVNSIDAYDELNVPENIILTESAKRMFVDDFKYYDFSQSDMRYNILSAWEHILEKDNVKRITMRQYKYFANEIKGRMDTDAREVSNIGYIDKKI